APAATNGDAVADWVWPTAGKVATGFDDGSSKGIDIPAKQGQPVYAASAGTVTLVSNAVRGYGNLVVIKHSQTLLSVYAHNSKVLVEEKQTVAKGQKIAEVGATDTDSPKLHFEIRRMGKPVDPLKFLPPR
ncbi:MAG TPA: peptidoglycan DD-metalloendopeptidase family protein, partial [Rhodocyclaceae bacterium]|nr:peptidoglycan DD-metalloendopeptidase family protein [Rhodocyclaceae bacterium]